MRGDCRKGVEFRKITCRIPPSVRIDGKFRQPRGGDQYLLNAARAFARDAAPLASRFVEHYMPQDFLVDLEKDIAAFEDAMNRFADAGFPSDPRFRLRTDDRWLELSDDQPGHRMI